MLSHFYPRSPCGERLQPDPQPRLPPDISIHALLAESDRRRAIPGRQLHTFLSTLSLRRATWKAPLWTATATISIHALLAESDAGRLARRLVWLYFYPRSPCGERLHKHGLFFQQAVISIHALLAESDVAVVSPISRKMYFYPRSPCGERLVAAGVLWEIQDFYPRSPCGERQTVIDGVIGTIKFLSTLSLRRATSSSYSAYLEEGISIHALLAESDPPTMIREPATSRFLSTLSLRRATALLNAQNRHLAFLSTLSLRRATRVDFFFARYIIISIHALLAESDQSRHCKR